MKSLPSQCARFLTATLLATGCATENPLGADATAPPVRSWGTAELIESDTESDATYPQVTVDSAGNAIAVWRQRDSAESIWANRYAVGSGWRTAELIETNEGNSFVPRVAGDSTGNAIAVWDQTDGDQYNIYANRYVAASGWGTAELIEANSAGDGHFPVVAMDHSGNAVAVWQQHDGAHSGIWANRYVVGSGWSSPELIDADGMGTNASYPEVAIDSAGNAVAVWQQHDGTRFSIWANRFVVGSGWGTAELIEANDAGNASPPEVAIDSAGNAIAVWGQTDGTRYSIWANRYAVASGWGSAALIETEDVGDAHSPEIAIDSAGNAVAVWQQKGTSWYSVWANRYAVGSGWGTAELIETDDGGNASHPEVAMDPAGDAVAVWQQHDGTYFSICAARYAVGSGWGTAELIETDDANHASGPEVAMDSAGNAVAVWQLEGARTSILANWFD